MLRVAGLLFMLHVAGSKLHVAGSKLHVAGCTLQVHVTSYKDVIVDHLYYSIVYQYIVISFFVIIL